MHPHLPTGQTASESESKDPEFRIPVTETTTGKVLCYTRTMLDSVNVARAMNLLKESRPTQFEQECDEVARQIKRELLQGRVVGPNNPGT